MMLAVVLLASPSPRQWWNAPWPREPVAAPGVVRLEAFAPDSPPPAPGPSYAPDPLPQGLAKAFEQQHFRRDAKSGNYLGPKVSSRTPNESLVPVSIGGKWATDLRGRPVFVRQSIHARLLAADAAMFKEKKKHLVINYGFRSNALQQELYNKLHGKGKVAPAGQSFHDTGMAVDLSNWREAQKFMIEAGFVGGCYGIEEDLVHYSVSEITKASNATAFKRCTLKEIPEAILKGLSAGLKKTGQIVGKLKKE